MMKRIALIAIGSLLTCLIATDGWAQGMSSESFDKLKKLEGNWKGVKPDGEPVDVSYNITSGGSAIVETLMPEGEPDMVTVYHMDGEKLIMTHYCSAGNQPRMEVSSTNDGYLDFTFVDATNLKSKSEGHMQGLKIVFVDENHFNQAWTWSKDNEEMPSTFKYEREM